MTDSVHDDVSRRATALVLATADELPHHRAALTDEIQHLLAREVGELRDESSVHTAALRELRAAGTAENLTVFTDVVRRGRDLDLAGDDAAALTAAEEYARWLARRRITPGALDHAYRLGQQHVLHWFLDRIAGQEADPRVAVAAGRRVMDIAFAYVAVVSRHVMSVYESERERWATRRGSQQAAALSVLLAEGCTDQAATEKALGYGLSGPHLAVIAQPDAAGPSREDRTDLLRRTENALAEVGALAGAARPPLLVLRDQEVVWAWIPLRAGGLDRVALSEASVTRLLGRAHGLRLALGAPASGPEGFRATHRDAVRAQDVARLAGARGPAVTAFFDAEVRLASLLATDPDAARSLVSRALGPLAQDTQAAGRLRQTLHGFLDAQGSYVAAAGRLHLHRNTVRYRVRRAVELRGRPLDEDRLELELALVACRRLGHAVLAPGPAGPAGPAGRDAG
ncbi:hypothetical protein GTW43_07195 [Streptomyces sp. SID5785]|uniref:PucR family transcriptional regulator n=1 Tax=Streptomyces sp. SID5785 TaxID=2690309 RepID=UPI001360FDB2|nr:helix-turn-helix domain-containing protein [Streptomyces sp. SID5785]MZD04869.1 hypothetical protein [Streptomyces sp. SID5785]